MSDIFDYVEDVLKEMNIQYKKDKQKEYDLSPAKSAGGEKKIIERFFIVDPLTESGFCGFSKREDPRGTIAAINKKAFEKELRLFTEGVRKDMDMYTATFVESSGESYKLATIGVDSKIKNIH